MSMSVLEITVVSKDAITQKAAISAHAGQATSCHPITSHVKVCFFHIIDSSPVSSPYEGARCTWVNLSGRTERSLETSQFT